MILDTPEIVKGNGYDCGAVALEILFRFHKQPRPRWVPTLAYPLSGIQPDTMRAACHSVFGNALAGPMTLGILAGCIADGKPVLCPVVLPGDEVSDSHWVAVRGIERGRVFYQDPTDGRQSLPVKDWMKAWNAVEDPWKHYAVTGWPEE